MRRTASTAAAAATRCPTTSRPRPADQSRGRGGDRRDLHRHAVLDRERHRLGLRRYHREQRRGEPDRWPRRQRHGVLRPFGPRPADQPRGRGGGRRDLHRHLLLDRERDRHEIQRCHARQCAGQRSRRRRRRIGPDQRRRRQRYRILCRLAPRRAHQSGVASDGRRRRQRYAVLDRERLGSAFGDVFVSSDAANRIDGGGGSDAASYDISARGQLINLAGGAATDGIFTDTLLSIENAIGSAFGDVIVSSDAANRIDGRGGSDTVSYDLSARGQLINLAGGAATDGIVTDTFSSIENAIGTQFADRIVAGADANRLEGRGGNDTFVFQRGQANGDTVTDFAGNGAGAGDTLEFVGYGPGATFVQLDGTHWQINSGDGFTHETITLQNAAAVHQSDVLFL